MEKHTQVFRQFADFERLYDGYVLARRNKRYKEEVLHYTAHLEDNLINSLNHLLWKDYEITGVHEFLEFFPKKRIVTALQFKDRVVNCAAYNTLYPIYRPSFYEHSYGCIPGRGPEKAVNQLQYWMRLIRTKPGKWYIGKTDIAKFYFRIPVETQLDFLSRSLDDPDMMWFLETSIRADGRAMGLPVDAPPDVETAERIPGIGMQVGSPISQLTANLVMTATDNFIKRDLKIPYYIRLMDDMIMLAPSKSQVEDAIGALDDFLQERLGLQLNGKTAVMPYDAGVEFVGRRVWPDKIKLRNATALRMKQHLAYIQKHYSTGELPLEYCENVLQSYLGLLSHCYSDALRTKILDTFVLVRHSDSIFDPDDFPDNEIPF